MDKFLDKTIKIERGIPVPPAKMAGNRWARGGRWATALRAMALGDSFLAPARALQTIYSLCKRNGWKIRMQTQPKRGRDKLSIVRIWLLSRPEPGLDYEI